MITTATAENALKNIYLDTVINDINKKTNPFLTMIEENARTASGKNATFNIRYGQAAVGAGTETGDLPVGDGEKSLEIAVPLKNLYGTFQISDKALKAASMDPNAFASLLGGEMQNLVAAAQNNLTTMLYGNGKKILAVIDADAIQGEDRNLVEVGSKYIHNFTANMKIVIENAAGEQITDVVSDTTISSINVPAAILTLSQELDENKADRYYIYNKEEEATSMNGIDTIFQPIYYGKNMYQYPEITACNYIDESDDLHVLDEDAALDFLDAYEEHCQSMPADILLTHPRVKKAIFESLKSTRSNIATAELAGGFHGFTFNGIPLYSDVKCKAGNLYALNSKSFAMHQLCDWTWLSNEDGSILKQLPGKATYMATLVKYADLICDKPFLQGRCSNFSALQSKAE